MSIDQTIPEQRVPDLVRATLRGRLLLVALILVAAGLVAAFQFFGLPFLKAAVSATSSANAIATIKAVLIGMMAVLVCAGAYVIWYGRKISRHGQFPLPNAWVLRDMPIKRGGDAVKVAWLHYTMGALIGILGIVLIAYLWIMLDRLAPQFKLPPGVTIVQQRTFSNGK